MTCKIDHSDPLAVPIALCRACTVFAPHVQEATTQVAHVPQEPWPFAVRRSSCTDADIEAMHMLMAVRETLERDASYARVAALSDTQKAQPKRKRRVPRDK